MTGLLACVDDASEAVAALDAGFDGILTPEPAAHQIRPAGASRRPVVAWIETAGPAATLVVVDGDARRQLAVCAVTGSGDIVPDHEATGGVLLRSAERLLDVMPFTRLAAVVRALRADGVAVALAGGLEPPDMPRLLALQPAMLIVGRSLRTDGTLDGRKLAAMRALVPRDNVAPSTPAMTASRRDRIFVRDLVLALEIGAYASERGRQQRVRFSVEAELAPSTQPMTSMSGIVSYDLIADAIRTVASAARVDFVELLAEEIAATVLLVPRIVAVSVRVEKLDLGAGAVGVEIMRTNEPDPR